MQDLSNKRGIIKIFNLKTDRVYFTKSGNIEKDIISIRFQLDLAMYSCQSLQEEYASLGLELFTIEAEKIVGLEENLDLLLAETEKEYIAKGYSFYR
ncbi:MAG: hypothetical protein GX903_08465 [Spirochaetales bacterium]|nr:hypothetical protein [Spirochaetales bacterium]